MILKKVLHVPGSGFNLISISQLQDAKCPVILTNAGFKIGLGPIKASRHKCGLYFIDTWDETCLKTPQAHVLSAQVDDSALEFYYSCLGYISEQNVIKTAAITKGINLTKPPS